MIPRRSSGSSRADRGVEPTRSQNITVSCRRSAASCGFAPVDAEAAAEVSAAAKPEMALRRRLRCPSGTPSFSDLGQLRQDIGVDFIRAKERLVLSEPETFEPTPDIHVRTPRARTDHPSVEAALSRAGLLQDWVGSS